MNRQVVAAVLALCLWPGVVYAQAQVRVTGASADVRSAPSMVNPVIGRAPHGSVLELTRNVGDWYKVSWPDASDGVGYVRRTDVAFAEGGAATVMRTPAASASADASRGSSPQKLAVLADLSVDRQPSARRASHLAAPSHRLGIGALMGPLTTSASFGFGVVGRAWSNGPLGVQLALTRQAMRSVATAGHMTTMQAAPSVLLALPDHLSDFVWFRPYVGAGGHLNRSMLSGIGAVAQASSTSLGLQAFGGGELTLAGAPQLAISADAGYRWGRAGFDGFDVSGIGVSIAAHWYLD